MNDLYCPSVGMWQNYNVGLYLVGIGHSMFYFVLGIWYIWMGGGDIVMHKWFLCSLGGDTVSVSPKKKQRISLHMHSHSNHMISSKEVNTLICYTTMHSNPINFLYSPGHMTFWCVEVGLVANAREGSTQEHDLVYVRTHENDRLNFRAAKTWQKCKLL